MQEDSYNNGHGKRGINSIGNTVTTTTSNSNNVVSKMAGKEQHQGQQDQLKQEGPLVSAWWV